MSTSTDISLKLWVVLNRAVGSISDRLREQVESHGLSYTEFAVLEVLFHKGALPLGTIGEKVLLTSGSMTYVIDKLERRELLSRRTCVDDRRVIFAELTEPGKRLMENVFPEHAETIDEVLGGLSLEERLHAIDLMRRLGLHAQRYVPA